MSRLVASETIIFTLTHDKIISESFSKIHIIISKVI
jgi:hypothetical protein